MQGRVYASEHDSKVVRHFRREQTMELILRNFYKPSMESFVRKYYRECDNCQRSEVPRHDKHGLLRPLEFPCKSWMYISTDLITDMPESEGATMIIAVVDRFTKMDHLITLSKADSPTVGKTYLHHV